MTPDAQPIIGESEEIKGFFNAAGYSGHGYMLAPATGEVIAEIITEGKASTVNVVHLTIDRLQVGTFETEHIIV